MSTEIILEKNIYSLKKLSEWFHISPGTLRNKKEKYLEFLKEYARYETLPSGKINILEIYIPVYVKPDSTYKKIKSKVTGYWDKSGLDKKKWVAEKLYSKEELQVKYNTVYSYICKASNELWGKPSSLEGGEVGNCHWVLCAKNLDTGKLRQFSTEESLKQYELRKKYFEEKKKETEAQKAIKDSLRLQYKKKEITTEEYKETLFSLEEAFDEVYIKYFQSLQDMLPKDEVLDWGILVEEYIYIDENNFNFESELGKYL